MKQRLGWGLTAVAFGIGLAGSAAQAADPNQVIDTYVRIAHAKYEDSLETAKILREKIDAFLAEPTEETLAEAREAWVAARVPYQQTEVYRFGNAIVDDWEGKVNAWPLDEGLIDYVVTDFYGDSSDANVFYTANVVANEKLEMGGRTIDASTIDPALLANDLHELDGVEANVATGYHAIEFLLWGQDLNGTGPGAGDRPASDFDIENCTHGNCDRRAQYLEAATDLLISDLEWMTAQWADGGAAATGLREGDPVDGVRTIVTGMGSLSYGELAGERMKLGLMLHDPEEEHDCFSDNTHWSHYYDAVGIRNVFRGEYEGPDGETVEGPGLKDLLPEEEKRTLAAALDDTVAKMQVMVDRAESGEHYDQMIGPGNDKGNTVVQAAIDALLVQTQAIERGVAALNLGSVDFEGSDSLDSPETVIQ